MAGISVGGEGGGRKSSNSEIPLIPFIDLLLCCVMFLLVTAVWNQLASINANQQMPGVDSPVTPVDSLKTILQVKHDGYVLASTAGDRVEIPRAGEQYDLEELRSRLGQWKKMAPNRSDLIVAPEDGVRYRDIIAAMDVSRGERFTQLTLSDGSGF